jgi:uncharacterized membrane protein
MREDAGPLEVEGRRAAFAAWLFTLAGSVVLVLMTLAAPVLRHKLPRLSALLYAVFAPLCHQDPGRCFSLAGHPIAVCGRCLGIDLGFVIGALAYPLFRGFARPRPPAVRTFLLASFPIGLDVAGNVAGLWTSPIGVRFAAGLLWGALLPAYFITGLQEVVMRFPGFRARSGKPRLNLRA